MVTPVVTVSPEPGGRSWSLPEVAWKQLPVPDPTSVLYPLQVTALDDLPSVTLTGCPEPAVVTTEEEWKAAVRAQWSCVHLAWVPCTSGSAGRSSSPL
ncbi:hypothetical protein G7085_03910 [Tessaracoccus sp. HDW20]|uniref:hypothetical protein n=1 Tax=Tessaracoccus coleopterorum TaxID=2714950 RepID=UPI0018D36FFA|nr:hypothetical protein [Tessaracoccus coleopterorum]NHB84079.1 hypothetical protein [Tessaracoccus coleopterorum]